MPSINNHPLPKPQRTQLENTVKAARDVAEKAASAALAQLAVADGKAPDYLTEPQRFLRRKLRAHARSLGDSSYENTSMGVQYLVWEVAYEHWHRMLFARFLAENGLLLWEVGAAVSLDDCEALVQETDPAMNLGAKTKWELAGKLAARMLPQVFKPQSPVFELSFAPEHQRELERLLGGLSPEVFHASDSLGWVYQFWQAKRKEEVNASEVKIGADELPAVTQLFTEPYMVDFLLHNSLGAWWVTRHPKQPCPVPLTYLRTVPSSLPLPLGEGGGEGEPRIPAAGQFQGWPDTLAEFTLLDPCCGSGHFLVAAFLMLVPMRMAAEGLSAADAVDAVLAHNLHGLELDARCVEIAVFALALAAWRFPDENGDPLGVRAYMPTPQVACCGLKLNASADDWTALIPKSLSNSELLAQDLKALQANFAQAPLLGSLLDPSRFLKDDLATSNVEALRELVTQALAHETPARPADTEHSSDVLELALAARGLLDAVRLLNDRYHLVITNVPYLARGKQNDTLKSYCETHYPDAKNDLANVFLERCLELALPPSPSGRGAGGEGVVQIVMPQNWLFLTSYKKQRESLLKRVQWNLLARLGPGAFETISGEVVQAILLTQTRAPALESFELRGVDASPPKGAQEKAVLLLDGELVAVSQKGQLGNPDALVTLDSLAKVSALSAVAGCFQGTSSADNSRFQFNLWEIARLQDGWELLQNAPDGIGLYRGRELIINWQRLQLSDHAYAIRGREAWKRKGVSLAPLRNMPSCIYSGHLFTDSAPTIVPRSETHLPAILAYAESGELVQELRKQNSKVVVNNGYVNKVPFDLARWQQIAAKRYPNGLPKPYSDDPTQWLFHGHPHSAIDPLQVVVARLMGYRWPAETDTAMELSDEARTWIARCDKLADHTDDDGIVCLPSVRGETPAHDRLLKLLIAAWETVEPGSWKPAVLDKLLADADCAGKGLDVWLREKFFEQHAKRFHHRPFIWHVWDGQKDGFAALVNYHKLNTKHLERLIHTYLGDWIRQQEAATHQGVDGAPTRLAAAQDLKRRLERILEGDPPYDIFVRWKKLSEQPIGWNPDLNDGVRLNIRPFMTAEVLRHNKKPKLNITWDKDRGKDVESAPWFKTFGGDRINDHHLTRVEKMAARFSEFNTGVNP